MALFKYGEIEQNLIESSLIPFGVFQRIGSKVTAIAVTQGLCNLFGFDSLQEILKEAKKINEGRIVFYRIMSLYMFT